MTDCFTSFHRRRARSSGHAPEASRAGPVVALLSDMRCQIRPFWLLASTLALAAPLAACGSSEADASASADKAPSPRQAARAAVAAGALLLDVRSAEEFAAGHLPGARNLPVDQVAARIDEVPTDRPLVVYCRSGRRSASASATLRARGLEVIDLGPMSAW